MVRTVSPAFTPDPPARCLMSDPDVNTGMNPAAADQVLD
jgi:hypothetical protein